MSPLVIASVIGSLIVGWAGRRRKIGFLGFAAVSFLLTPLVGFAILYLTAQRRGARAAA
jgi:hypothetical protein